MGKVLGATARVSGRAGSVRPKILGGQAGGASRLNRALRCAPEYGRRRRYRQASEVKMINRRVCALPRKARRRREAAQRVAKKARRIKARR